jgi:hypothetical membrane protein
VIRPPGWALGSAVTAVVALVGGWLLAGARQPPHYDPVHDTISALARHGAHDRWIMTAGLALLGLGHVITAVGLAALRPASRAVLAAGGVATMLVAAFAQPDHGSSTAHLACATVGFVVLAVWPVTAATRRPIAALPLPLRPGPAGAATVVSLGLLGWVAATQGGGPLGLAERLLTADQALWPLVVVVAARRTAARIDA